MNTPDPLEVATLQTVLWRGTNMQQACAYLLTLALQKDTCTGADLPGEITGGSIHLSGVVVATLLKTELLEFVGYTKSKRESARGRRVAVLRIPDGGRSKVQSWLRKMGYSDPSVRDDQQLLLR